MSSRPRLIIGIPSFGRPERCQSAIASVLWQSLPARVIVADDSDNDETEEMCRQFADHPCFSYRRSPATTLWRNWEWVAREAIAEGAEFFTWLQNDDILSPKFARRVVRSFDQFPRAQLYCANLLTAYNNMLGVRWDGNWGPRIPLDHLFGNPITFHGKLLTPIAYCDSWSLSPAKSFRVGDAFNEMLGQLPDGADSMTEVMDTAYMGLFGPVIADPQMAGYWMLHESNESELTRSKRASEEAVGLSFLDGLMSQVPEWASLLVEWANFAAADELLASYIATANARRNKSVFAGEIADCLSSILESRKSAAA